MSHCKDIQNHKASPEYTQMLSLSTCNRVIKLQELIEFVHSYEPTLLTQYMQVVGKHVELNGSTRQCCLVNLLSNTLWWLIDTHRWNATRICLFYDSH